jgi:thioredoxin reductase
MYDAFIVGGGAAGMSCALVLGSAISKPFATNKRIAIAVHQKSSHLQTALFNNVLGLAPDILETGKSQLNNLYSHIEQIEKEKVTSVLKSIDGFIITTNKNKYHSKRVVITVGYTNLLSIKGLESYIEPHPRAAFEKDRIWLRNEDHVVDEGLYVAGTLAGWRSQFAIASGSGAQVATDILTLWNDGKHTKIHDKV